MILDTNALSAAADEEAAVLGVLRTVSFVALPVVVLGEYRAGIARSRYRRHYESWLNELLADCRVLDVNLETTDHYAAINLELREAGKPIPTNDLWIAALCRQHALSLLSRDRHFDYVPKLDRVGW